ncbi:MAG: transporter substrate-binding domain-containing protein [Succinivibrio sp.]
MFKFLRITLIYTLLSISMLSLQARAEDKKILNVGCEGAFAPFTYINDQGEITGFDIDLIKVLAEDMGYEVKINVMPFDGLIPSLMTGGIDLIISGFSILEERAKKVDFSQPYYLCGMSYVIDKKNASKFDTYEKLDGQPVCTQLASAGTTFTQKFLKGAEDKIFNSPPETYIELGNERCVAAIHDKPVNDFFLTKDTSGRFTSIEITKNVNKEYYGIAVQKGNSKLLKEVNDALDNTSRNGKFEEVSRKWFGINILDSLKQ